MRRLQALLGKELRQHALAGAGLGACLAAASLIMLMGAWMNDETVSLMVAHAGFLFFVTLAALVLANRLVVTEYYGRTQLFVEALPLARWEMVAVKYVLGLALLLLAAALSLGVTALLAATREAIDARFLGIVGARTGSYVFFIWSFFFGMGLIGRFRVPIYLALLIVLFFVDDMTAFQVEHFGPLAVLDNHTLPFEREVMPVRAVLETLAWGAGWTILAFALALIYEGSVAEALARRMSQREKSLIAILFVAAMLAFFWADERRDKEPYAFELDEVARSETSPIEILYLLPELRDDAEALLGRLETDLESLSALLGWQTLPGVHVSYGPSLDAGLYDEADLWENEGILVRVNFRSGDGWDPRDFSAHVVGLVLDEVTRGRAGFEPKAWLRDAFALWWSVRGPESDAALASPDLELACRSGFAPVLRALWATREEPLDEEQVVAWRRTRERLGEDLAEAVAVTGLLVLEQRQGRDAVESLAREVFGRQPPRDARELLYEWRNPMPTVFRRATGIDWLDLVASWSAELQRLRDEASCRAALAEIPEPEVELRVEPAEGTARDVVYSFRFASPPPPGTLVTMLHDRLSAFDYEIERRDLRRVEKLWPAGETEASWRLPGLYSQGSRAFLALEIESTTLRCPIRLYAERWEIP